MAGTTGTLTDSVVALLTSRESGINVRIGAIESGDGALKAIGIRYISAQNVSVEIAEKAGHAQYPALLVYCEKVQNLLKEKFRQFSGQVHLVIEVRHSQDKLDKIEQNTQMYADAVCALLDDSRGDWGDGAFYAGGYQVSYEPVVKGGKNFLQRAKVNFALEVSD
jgi:hypothetical protein